MKRDPRKSSVSASPKEGDVSTKGGNSAISAHASKIPKSYTKVSVVRSASFESVGSEKKRVSAASPAQRNDKSSLLNTKKITKTADEKSYILIALPKRNGMQPPIRTPQGSEQSKVRLQIHFMVLTTSDDSISSIKQIQKNSNELSFGSLAHTDPVNSIDSCEAPQLLEVTSETEEFVNDDHLGENLQ